MNEQTPEDRIKAIEEEVERLTLQLALLQQEVVRLNRKAPPPMPSPPKTVQDAIHAGFPVTPDA